MGGNSSRYFVEPETERTLDGTKGPLKPYEGGMLREDKSSKTDYTLTFDGPMFRRWAQHMTKGARGLPDPRNWLLARGEKELLDFKAAAARHFIQWYYGEDNEDHAAALFFNVNGAEYVKSLTPASQDEAGKVILEDRS